MRTSTRSARTAPSWLRLLLFWAVTLLAVPSPGQSAPGPEVLTEPSQSEGTPEAGQRPAEHMAEPTRADGAEDDTPQQARAVAAAVSLRAQQAAVAAAGGVAAQAAADESAAAAGPQAVQANEEADAEDAAESGPVVSADGPEVELPDDLGGVLDLPSTGTGTPGSAHGGPAEGDKQGATLTERLSEIVDKTVLGGYGEYEFHAPEGENSYFQHHRYILFVYSQISERISTATEIEFEFGGSPRKSGGALGFGEVLLEFSVVDFKIVDALVLRAGIILVPVGAFNIRHDAPTRDLTERPIAYTTVVPTTWFEAGAGVLGSFELGAHRFDYELYAINGLDAKLDHEMGLRGARGSLGEDNNGDKAIVGRFAWLPALGFEVALSGYTGEYNKRDDRVNLAALDLFWRAGRFELLFEAVRVFVDPGFVEGFEVADVNTREAVPEGMAGFFVQGNLHFVIPWLWDLFPPDLSEATFTAVLRYEEMDASIFDPSRGDRQRLTLGLNFRPVEAFVVKTDYQLNWSGPHGVVAWLDDAIHGGDLYEGGFVLGRTPSFAFVSSAAILF